MTSSCVYPYILRNAFASSIPEEIRNRPKVAYQAPDVKGFVHDGTLPEYVRELLGTERIRQAGLFDCSRVSQLATKAQTTNLRRVGNRDNMAFVLVLSTMLLDDIFVKRNQSFTSDIKVNLSLNLV